MEMGRKKGASQKKGRPGCERDFGKTDWRASGARGNERGAGWGSGGEVQAMREVEKGRERARGPGGGGWRGAKALVGWASRPPSIGR